MTRIRFLLLLLLLGEAAPFAGAADAPKADPAPVELVGQVADFWFSRNWSSYYWREDFTFLLTHDKGRKRRIISREPTPAYDFRMGTTYTGLKVDWKARPRVKVIGIQTLDRIPADFYDFKLDADVVTAMIVFVETAPNTWKEYYINNWFHKWGARADKALYAHYAGKAKPYDIYGFVNGQTAPFSAKSQAIIKKNRANPSLMFHGLIRTSKATSFGYEIELTDLIGRDVKTGGPALLYGDAKTIPRLDSRKPAK